MNEMKVYLAGPDVFFPDAATIGRQKVDLCARHGHQGLFPLDNEISPDAGNASLQIFRGNESMMDRADAIVANLTPFRGPSADAGTVYELGYMAGKSKLCLGYSNDPSQYVDRVLKGQTTTRPSDGRLVDENGLSVENFGQSDNLMIAHTLEVHGYPLVIPSAVPSDLWHDLTSFEACLRLLAQHETKVRAQRGRS
jgi:nucleoside 2-deoxyribosyltransferase